MTTFAAACPYADLFAPEFVADPYPALAIARREEPVRFLPDLNLWLVTRYADVRTVLRNPEVYTNANVQQPLFPFAPGTVDYLKSRGFAPGPALTGSDGALHKRLRGKVAKALDFTPRSLVAQSALVEHTAQEMVDALPRSGRFDIVAALTARFPARVVFRLIGFPERDHDQLLAWCMDRLRMFFGYSEAEEQLPIAEGLAAYWQYCVGFVASPEAREGDTIGSRLIAMHEDDPETLSATEVAGILFGLVFAGQETTANVLAETILLLLRDRSRWEAVRADRALIDRAFSEALRLSPPIAAWRRLAAVDTEIAGQPIPAGAHLLLHLGSTGHDESKFADGETFDLTRTNGEQHLAFGSGPHFCLGAPLAKMEVRELLKVLLDREPALSLAPQMLDYIPNISFRGPRELWVERSPG